MLADCVHQLGRAPQYFRTLAVIVCNRSELIAGEKRLMRISELLLIKEVQTAKKSRECEQMKKSHRRDELLRLRRSQLGLCCAPSYIKKNPGAPA